MIDPARILQETFVAGVECHPCLDSTNNRAAQCAKDKDVALPLLIVADKQTAGRGRGSNRWWSGEGALAYSLLVDAQTVGAESGPTPLVALAVAVALVETVAPLLPDHPVGIHWPNDVMAAGRKLAGILIEAMPDRHHVIGIGLNTNNTVADAPEELKTAAITLRDLTKNTFDHDDVLVDTLKKLEQSLEQLRTDPGKIAETADRWCLQRGRTLTLWTGQRTISGRCLGIAADGALQLKTPSGLECFYSGTLNQPI